MSQNDQTEKKIEGFTFPCEFALKAMGLTDPAFEGLILSIVQSHAPEVKQCHCSCKPSKNSKYTSVTITFEAQSKEQMDQIYQKLTDHKRVLYAL